MSNEIFRFVILGGPRRQIGDRLSSTATEASLAASRVSVIDLTPRDSSAACAVASLPKGNFDVMD